MLRRRRLASFAIATVLFAAGVARAAIVERVVAVVGDEPVLWSELLHRAVVGRIQIRMQTHDPNVIGVQEQEMYKELLDRMIDDRLEEAQADKAHLAVSADEIDRGIANIAAQAQAQQGRSVTVADIMEEVHRRGMTEQDFRDEIRRQIVEGKLIELRVRPRVRVTDQDAHAAYQHWIQDVKEQQPVDVRLLALRIPAGSTKVQEAARMALGTELAERARRGEDFCQLVTQFSDDVQTRSTCGSRGAQPLSTLVQRIQDAVRSMKPGEVSDPILVSAGQDEAAVLVMPLDQARVPPFADVKGEMESRALAESLDHARKQWLSELRRNVYVDVRL
jgi:peptidyl-prolyl cis-trans isomerase SurA